MSNSIPSGALGLSIAVIVYTTICLIAGLLLFYLLWTQERRYSYVLILSVLVSIATTASLIQQLHYAFDWRTVKAGEYAMSSQLSTNAGAAISNGAHGLDLGLFWIQFYTYNANSLLILFWAMMLFCGTWRFYPKLSFLGPLRNHMETCSKVFAILFPVLLLSVAQAKPIASQELVFAIFCNINLVASCTAGAVLICLTLFKFIQARRSLNGSTFSSHGVSQGATVQETVTDGAPSGNQAKRNQRAIDRAIIIRFTVAFTILSIFEGADILFQVLSFQNAQINTSSGTPKTADFTISGAITDIVTFIPGVTCSLIAWAIWGTTRKYLDETKRLFRSIFCCCCNNRGRRIRSRQGGLGGRGNIYELRDTVVAGGQQKQQFRRLSSGKDGMSDDKRTSVSGNDIRVLTELTVLESISDEELDIGGKDSGGFVGRNGSRHHTTVTTSAV